MQAFISKFRSPKTTTIAAALAAACTVGLALPAAEAMPLTAVPHAEAHKADLNPAIHKVRTYVVRRTVTDGKRVIRSGRLYDKSPNRVVVVVGGKRVVRTVGAGPVVRDHRVPAPTVRDHRAPTPTVRDHRTPTGTVRDHRVR